MSETNKDKYLKLRDKLNELQPLILELPECAERHIGITRLREADMWFQQVAAGVEPPKTEVE